MVIDTKNGTPLGEFSLTVGEFASAIRFVMHQPRVERQMKYSTCPSQWNYMKAALCGFLLVSVSG